MTPPTTGSTLREARGVNVVHDRLRVMVERRTVEPANLRVLAEGSVPRGAGGRWPTARCWWSRSPLGRITRVAPDGATSDVAETGGGPNGLAVAPTGRCSCATTAGCFEWLEIGDLLISGRAAARRLAGPRLAPAGRPRHRRGHHAGHRVGGRAAPRAQRPGGRRRRRRVVHRLRHRASRWRPRRSPRASTGAGPTAPTCAGRSTRSTGPTASACRPPATGSTWPSATTGACWPGTSPAPARCRAPAPMAPQGATLDRPARRGRAVRLAGGRRRRLGVRGHAGPGPRHHVVQPRRSRRRVDAAARPDGHQHLLRGPTAPPTPPCPRTGKLVAFDWPRPGGRLNFTA